MSDQDQARPADEPEEVAAEPMAPGEGGPSVDMPPPGTKAKHAEPGTSNMAIYGAAAACHLLGLVDMSISIMMIGLIAPLVLWLARKDADPEVDFAGKEAINFQLNLLFWQAIGFVLAFCFIGIPMLVVLSIAEIVLVILATIETFNGKRYRYPWIVRILD